MTVPPCALARSTAPWGRREALLGEAVWWSCPGDHTRALASYTVLYCARVYRFVLTAAKRLTYRPATAGCRSAFSRSQAAQTRGRPPVTLTTTVGVALYVDAQGPAGQSCSAQRPAAYRARLSTRLQSPALSSRAAALTLWPCSPASTLGSAGPTGCAHHIRGALLASRFGSGGTTARHALRASAGARRPRRVGHPRYPPQTKAGALLFATNSGAGAVHSGGPHPTECLIRLLVLAWLLPPPSPIAWLETRPPGGISCDRRRLVSHGRGPRCRLLLRAWQRSTWKRRVRW
jgi:hypothetical protein